MVDNPTNKDIFDLVTDTNEKMTALFEWKGTVEQRCKDRGKELEEIKDVTFGNPTPESGLVLKVQRLIDCKKFLNQSRINTREFWRPILQKLIVWVIIGLIVFLLVMYKKYG